MDTPMANNDNAGSDTYDYFLENLSLDPSSHDGTGGMIHCRNKEKGCIWIGEINDLENHLEKSDDCQHVDVRCPDCSTELERHHLMSHLKNECPLQVIDCPFCSITGERRFIEGPQHKVDCYVPCPNKCGIERISGEDMDEHQKICPLAIVQCGYHTMGCGYSMVRRDMEAHDKENIHEHLQLTRKSFDELTQEYVRFLDEHYTTEKAVTDLERKVQQITLKNVMADKRINQLEKELQSLKQKGGLQSHEIRSWIPVSWEEDNNVQAVTAGENNSIPVLPVYVKMSGFDKHRRSRARWYSDPFFSHDRGYKMCLHVKASGLGSSVRDVYVSVLLHLMKGPHDDELSWPITKAFHINLLNQVSNTNHWVRSACFATASEHITARVSGDYGETSIYGRGNFDYIPIKKISKIKPTCQYVKDDSIIFVIEQSPLESESLRFI